jgi:hypothetical protein
LWGGVATERGARNPNRKHARAMMVAAMLEKQAFYDHLKRARDIDDRTMSESTRRS